MKKLAPAHARGAASAARFATAASNFNAALARNDFRAGAQFAEEALRIVPGHMMVLSDYALCLMRIGAHEDAYKIYTNILAASPAKQRQASSTWFHGLVELCGLMGKHDELRRHGLRALNEADAMYRSSGIRLDAATQPPAFDPTRPEENIIAFSLFGANPRYCEPAVVNAQVTRELFKGWTCRVYLDDTVPQHVHRRLREAGAQLVEMNSKGPNPINPLMWRFLVIDDPSVKRFLLRDADSLLSEREAAAVEAWLDSPFLFHHMRDYCSHTELILAGLWGGCTGILPNIERAMSDYTSKRRQPAAASSTSISCAKKSGRRCVKACSATTISSASTTPGRFPRMHPCAGRPITFTSAATRATGGSAVPSSGRKARRCAWSSAMPRAFRCSTMRLW